MNTTLEIKIIDGRLVISIGTETLAWAADHSDIFCPYDDNEGDWIQKYKVSDITQFAEDVAHELENEEEDGSSMITNLLDKAIERALDNGSLGVDYGKDQ